MQQLNLKRLYRLQNNVIQFFSTRVDTSTVSSTTLTSPTTSTVQDSTSETTTTGDEATDKQTTQDKAFSEVAIGLIATAGVVATVIVVIAGYMLKQMITKK